MTRHGIHVVTSEEDYKKLKLAAFMDGMTVNKWIVSAALEKAAKYNYVIREVRKD